jgi:hypothetical protein
LEFDPAALRLRFKRALAAYVFLAVLAGVTLDGVLLYCVLLFLGALAVRSWLVVKREELE